MSNPKSVPMQRCCKTHDDWSSLARHLLVEFRDVPARAIFDELLQARQGGDVFVLTTADALECAELIVRYRVLTAIGRMPSRAPHTVPSPRRPAGVRVPLPTGAGRTG